MAAPLIEWTPLGLHCPRGGFYVDPWRPVPRAIVTHAHADHARWGCGRYLASRRSAPLLRLRLGRHARLHGLDWGETLRRGGVRVSLHPAGHILGSAQVRIEHAGQVAVVSGDYKRGRDATCAEFEPLRCDTFVTESTFGLPIFRWRPQAEVFAEIDAWWRGNAAAGRTSVLLGYSLGKAQRLMAGVDRTIGPVFTHGAVEKLTAVYRRLGVDLPETTYAGAAEKSAFPGALVVAPPSARGTPWLRRFGDYRTGLASGWMRVRGNRRRRAVDRGFVLSDHIDWTDLIRTIDDTGAGRVLVTHGSTAVVVKWLRERGLDADVLQTEYQGELEDDAKNETLEEGEQGATAQERA